ncbi:hypothetical protein LAZ67_11000346 [Cordylochernes scorpioides]|uniref:Angiotensin-converting enzyme n=1 Tax=Cordylochernes scorpioides TaxID=51811 RepID=A0ABY6L1L7_9ARAC|nr:hypothetical protein LAZ67_11000346 [Cordylochernes scorpioides]
MWLQATSFAWKNLTDPLVRRQFQKLAVLDDDFLPKEEHAEFFRIAAEMEDIYSQAKVDNLSLEPDLTRIFASSRNAEDLKKYWVGWRYATGKKIRSQYVKFVEQSNEVARANGFNDRGELWREPYESLTYEDDMAEQWEILRPFYLEMHAYVRMKLVKLYGEEVVKPDGPIPAHLLDVKDFGELFTSMGMKRMTPEFLHYSVLEKQEAEAMKCYTLAGTMCAEDDFCLLHCTVPTQEDLALVHHMMGNIQYFQHYANQPFALQWGANPSFHEAIGEVMELSVVTPTHLHKIGFLDKVENDTDEINFLMFMALEKIAFLPFSYLIDLWRWDVFRGSVNKLNDRWWQLRLQYQGLCPPVRRSETDFDPGAKNHVPGDTPQIRHFFSYILQFQLQELLCREAGHVGPLHTCDIYGSHAAGDKLAGLLRLGSSMPWQDALARMTGGSGKLDARPLLNYFAPLRRHIRESLGNSTVGWTSGDHNICP